MEGEAEAPKANGHGHGGVVPSGIQQEEEEVAKKSITSHPLRDSSSPPPSSSPSSSSATIPSSHHHMMCAAAAAAATSSMMGPSSTTSILVASSNVAIHKKGDGSSTGGEHPMAASSDGGGAVTMMIQQHQEQHDGGGHHHLSPAPLPLSSSSPSSVLSPLGDAPPYPPMPPRPVSIPTNIISTQQHQHQQAPPPMVDDSMIMKGGEAAKAADYANYFCSYAYLYHQKQMLTDHRRMSAYYNAIMRNADAFKGKTVLDVGTGTGVLAVWAAKAGAAKVVAVEFTDMAKHAQVVVNKNGVGHIVTVVQGSAEDLDMLEPQSVDIIVSEWMGYLLLRESMLDSLLRVREKFLKRDGSGSLWPSHCTMYWALVDDEEEREAKAQEFAQALKEWNAFTYETRQFYGIDLTGLSRQYEDEQKQYYLLSSSWAELKPEQVIGNPVEVYRLDLATCSFEDVKGVPDSPFVFHMLESTRVSGFTGWFTTDFLGSSDSSKVPLALPSVLSTGPEAGYTHWGQQVFYLPKALELFAGDRVEGSMSMTRQADNPRLYEVEVSFYVIRDGQPADFITHKYQMP